MEASNEERRSVVRFLVAEGAETREIPHRMSAVHSEHCMSLTSLHECRRDSAKYTHHWKKIRARDRPIESLRLMWLHAVGSASTDGETNDWQNCCMSESFAAVPWGLCASVTYRHGGRNVVPQFWTMETPQFSPVKGILSCSYEYRLSHYDLLRLQGPSACRFSRACSHPQSMRSAMQTRCRNCDAP